MPDGGGASGGRLDHPRNRRAGARRHAPRHRGDRRARRGAGAGRAASLPQAHGRGKPDAGCLPQERACPDRREPRLRLRRFPGADRAPTAARRHDVGRPAADARHRARPDVFATPAADRRAVGRPVAAAGRPDDLQDRGAEAAIRAHRADGGTELPPGGANRRSRLHHRARRDCLRGQDRRPNCGRTRSSSSFISVAGRRVAGL